MSVEASAAVHHISNKR